MDYYIIGICSICKIKDALKNNRCVRCAKKDKPEDMTVENLKNIFNIKD